MPLFEISNPSDPYTIKHDDWRAVCTAALLLGGGNYGLEEYRGERTMPIFVFRSADEWTKKEFGCDVDTFVKEMPREAVIECLQSVMIGSPGERMEFDLALDAIDDPEKKKAVIDARHDGQRTSMNNIGSRAEALANKLRKR